MECEEYFDRVKPDVLWIDLREPEQKPWWKNTQGTPHEQRMLHFKMEQSTNWQFTVTKVLNQQLEQGRGVLALIPEASVPSVAQELVRGMNVLRIDQEILYTNMRLESPTTVTALFNQMEKWFKDNAHEVFQEEND